MQQTLRTPFDDAAGGRLRGGLLKIYIEQQYIVVSRDTTLYECVCVCDRPRFFVIVTDGGKDFSVDTLCGRAAGARRLRLVFVPPQPTYSWLYIRILYTAPHNTHTPMDRKKSTEQIVLQ
jgi:hypothetical protein